MAYTQTNNTLPQFAVYPKRKSSKDTLANIYMQIGFPVYTLEKSLGIKINYKDWDATLHEVKGQPMYNFHIKQKTEEYKQKIMGSYYILTQHGGEQKIGFNVSYFEDDTFINPTQINFSDKLLRKTR